MIDEDVKNNEAATFSIKVKEAHKLRGRPSQGG
jgi:hypothetical protein